MKKITLMLWVICLLVTACSDPEIAPSSQPTKAPVNKKDDGSASTASFSYDRMWWSFYPNATASKYNSTYGSGPTAWAGEVNALTYHPKWIKTVHLNGEIYLFYFYNETFYLKKFNGYSWTAPQILYLDDDISAVTGYKVFPEVAVINGQIHIFQYTIWNYREFDLDVLRYSDGELRYVSTTPRFFIWDGSHKAPAYVYFQGQHYLMLTFGSELYYSRSLDGITWQTPVILGSPNTAGHAIDAASFKEHIYISYKKPNNYIGYAKFDGSRATFYDLNTYRSTSVHTPIETDGNTLAISYRANSSDYNFIAHTVDGATWTQTVVKGLSNHSYRDLIYLGN